MLDKDKPGADREAMLQKRLAEAKELYFSLREASVKHRLSYCDMRVMDILGYILLEIDDENLKRIVDLWTQTTTFASSFR